MSPRIICPPARCPPRPRFSWAGPPCPEPSLGRRPPDICGTCIPETFWPWGICLEPDGGKSAWESDGIWAMEAGPQAKRDVGAVGERRVTLPLHPGRTHQPAAVALRLFIAGAQPPSLSSPPSQAFRHGSQLPNALSFCPHCPCSLSARHHPSVPQQASPWRAPGNALPSPRQPRSLPAGSLALSPARACASRCLAPGHLPPAFPPAQRWVLGRERGGSPAGGVGYRTSVPECPCPCLSQLLPHHH